MNEELKDEGRSVKSAEQIAKLKKAARLTQDLMEYALSLICEGITEITIDGLLNKKMQEWDTMPSFPSIVAGGENSADPHAVPTDRKFCFGDFIKIDIGCCFEGYAGDMTRTFVLGKAGDRQKKIYETVKIAQIAGIFMAKDGIICKEADGAARKVIADAGYGECFVHGLGHGIGTCVHEFPRVNSASDTVLRNGMVVTIEPGIYVKGLGGVRIEDTVVIGGENFYDFTKELIVI